MEYVAVSTEQLQEWAALGLQEGGQALDLFDAWAEEALVAYGVGSPAVRPRILLISVTLTALLGLYSLFMVLLGVFLSRVFGSSGDAQIMQMIHQIEKMHDDVVRAKEHAERHKRSRAWWKSTLLLLVVPLEVAIAAVLYFYEADALTGAAPHPDYAQLALEASPLLLVPLLMLVLYKVLAFWHNSRITRNEEKLKELQKQHEELVKRYEEKIDAEQHKRVMTVIRDTRLLFGLPKQQQQQQQKPQQRKGTGAGTQVPVKGGPRARPSPAPRPPYPAAPAGQRPQAPAGAQAPIRQSAPAVRGGGRGRGGGAAGAEEAPAGGKLISSALGLLSGGEDSVELICQACGNHCGSQSKDELLQFDCAACGAFNDGSKRAPAAAAPAEVESAEAEEKKAEKAEEEDRDEK